MKNRRSPSKWLRSSRCVYFVKKQCFHYLFIALGILVLPKPPKANSITGRYDWDRLGTTQTLTGPDYDITETLGTKSGNNLFHSFETFNINTGESATFSGNAAIDTIISRVTGGEVSNINAY